MATPRSERWVGLVGTLQTRRFVVIRTQPPPQQLVVALLDGDSQGREVLLSVQEAAQCGLRPRSRLQSTRLSSASVVDDCAGRPSWMTAWGASVGPLPQAERRPQNSRSTTARAGVEAEHSSSDEDSSKATETRPASREHVLEEAANCEAAAESLVAREVTASRRDSGQSPGGPSRLDFVRQFAATGAAGMNSVFEIQARILSTIIDGIADVGAYSPGGLRLSALVETCFARAERAEELLLAAFRKSFITQSKQRVWLCILRRSTDLAAVLLRVLVPKILPRLRRTVQEQIVAFHRSKGRKLKDEGPLSRYRFKILRTTPSGNQSFERWAYGSDGEYGIYEAVRKAKLCQPTATPGPLLSKGLVKRLTCKITPRRLKSAKRDDTRLEAVHTIQDRWRRHSYAAGARDGLSPSRQPSAGSPSAGSVGGSVRGSAGQLVSTSGRQPASAANKPSSGGVRLNGRAAAAGAREADEEARTALMEGADVWLEQQLPRCVAGTARAMLPDFVKAHLPAEFDEAWMPAHMRDEPDKVLALDVDLFLEIRFDQAGPTAASRRYAQSGQALHGDRDTATAPGELGKPEGAKIEFALLGDGCWPSVGFLQLKHLTLQARAKVWWDVFDYKFDICVPRGEDCAVDWDVELALGGCGLASCALPDCIEDELGTRLANLVLRSFTQQNPIKLDVSGHAGDAAEAAEERDAAARPAPSRRSAPARASPFARS